MFWLNNFEEQLNEVFWLNNYEKRLNGFGLRMLYISTWYFYDSNIIKCILNLPGFPGGPAGPSGPFGPVKY